MPINNKEYEHLVCPECLCFDEDFEGTKSNKEGMYCPFCFEIKDQSSLDPSNPELKLLSRKEFYVLIAKRIIAEFLD